MKLVDTEETVVLVTGTSLTAEERDRPLAYLLKSEIDQRGAGHAYRRAVVVGDAWYLDNLKRATLWGVNAAATAAAVEVFTTQGHLEELLGKIWRFRVTPSYRPSRSASARSTTSDVSPSIIRRSTSTASSGKLSGWTRSRS
jgi:hypothetical protein